MTEPTEDRARIAAHDEAMRRYGPVPDYTTLAYEQVVAFERGAAWQRRDRGVAAGADQ